jgi:hypothetical protein
MPYVHAVEQVFLGGRGILIASPVIVAAAAGLVLLGRRYRLEAIVCGTIFGAFVLVNCGYFLPYGGVSPGPRFLVPALPFVALGLAPAVSRWPRTTATLAAASIVAMTGVTLTWRQVVTGADRLTPWQAIGRVLTHDTPSFGSHPLLTMNALDWIGIGRLGAAVLVSLAVAAAFILALARRSPSGVPAPVATPRTGGRLSNGV